MFLLLGIAAIIYAFLSGLRTIFDPDVFWQLATGRWIVLHHHIFSVDVFSYTASGQPWIYPVGSGLIFYAAYVLGGYALLSWVGAAACVGSVALLLRKGSAVSAAFAIFAVPLIAKRTAPRADMFSVVLFAAYLSILWENRRTGRGRLWLLPLLMLAWVNLHLGFIAGLLLMLTFVVLDLLQALLPGAAKSEARQRLRRCVPWFAASALVTLANPWGWNLYVALVRQSRVLAEHSSWFAEWGRVPLRWNAVIGALSLSNPGSFYFLLAILVIALVVALLRREFAAAVLLACGAYEGLQHIRMEAISACIFVIVGGAVLTPEVKRLGLLVPTSRVRALLASGAAATMLALTFFWSSGVLKVQEMGLSSYGAGLSWWFPERACQFIQREKLPAQVFNTFNEGSFVLWALGPNYSDYIDGRTIPFGSGAMLRQVHLMQSSPDSSLWQEEAERYGINTIVLPLNRFESELGDLKKFCNSDVWKPVYLDEVTGVFVRRSVQTEGLLKRLQIDCATAPLPAETTSRSMNDSFNQWANAGTVLAALGRNLEALSAADKAAQLVPSSSFVPWLRGNIYFSMGLRPKAEQEYLKAVSAAPATPLYWFSLATLYKYEDKIPQTIDAQRKAIELSTLPKPFELLKLGRLYLEAGQPQAALQTFDEAFRSASPDVLAESGQHNFRFEVDQGRAAAWRALGDNKRATEFDQKAVQDLVSQE